MWYCNERFCKSTCKFVIGLVLWDSTFLSKFRFPGSVKLLGYVQKVQLCSSLLKCSPVCILHRLQGTETASVSHGMLLRLVSKFLGILPNRIHQCVSDVPPPQTPVIVYSTHHNYVHLQPWPPRESYLTGNVLQSNPAPGYPKFTSFYSVTPMTECRCWCSEL
jgi:hypothetical protein